MVEQLLSTYVILTLCFLDMYNFLEQCPFEITERGLTAEEETQIVDAHNNFRLDIAKGNIPGQPKGTNLKRLRYDPILAKKAQEIADTCKYGHVKVQDDRFLVGQNLRSSWSSSDIKPNWNKAVQSWFSENRFYKYPAGFAKKTSHYTQVVWADTTNVGCGFVSFKSDNKIKQIYVCNYGPRGNLNNKPPYETGSSGCENLCD